MKCSYLFYNHLLLFAWYGQSSGYQIGKPTGGQQLDAGDELFTQQWRPHAARAAQ
jgi:hypothetical protein